MDKQFLAYLSTSTLGKVYFGLLSDKSDLRAIDKITTKDDGFVDESNYIGTAIDKVDELMAEIAEEVVGNRGETL